jgi:hypothetical protein
MLLPGHLLFEYLATALVPSEMACLASWTSLEVTVLLWAKKKQS